MNICQNHDCLGNYNFEHIAHYAKKRFIDGYDTMELLEQAKTESEKEEIALVCMLDIEDKVILDIGLSCKYDTECKVTDCRARLKKMIEDDLARCA